jgi:hypothetical protein
MRFGRAVLALGLAALAGAGVYLLGDGPRATGGDGRGHRIALGAPATMVPGMCPDYRNNADARYFWDMRAFAGSLKAQLSHCGQVDTGPLGEWVVEERSDSRGGYSISALLDARSHTVVHDWGGHAPSMSLHCWRGDDDSRAGTAGPLLAVWLWHFGPPQQIYGEPTPVRYRFEGYRPTEVALWMGHPAQAEVALLLPGGVGTVDQGADSRVFAAGLRQAAAANTDEDSGPLLEFETWSGATAAALDRSQGKIEFDLLGVERAGFPVLDACGA